VQNFITSAEGDYVFIGVCLFVSSITQINYSTSFYQIWWKSDSLATEEATTFNC